jgi:hypothetical protein
MPKPLTPVERMMRECERAPRQHDRKLILADYLEERGEHLMALAYRYAAAHDHLPERVVSFHNWPLFTAPHFDNGWNMHNAYAWYVPSYKHFFHGASAKRATVPYILYIIACDLAEQPAHRDMLYTGGDLILCQTREAAWTCLGLLLDEQARNPRVAVPPIHFGGSHV